MASTWLDVIAVIIIEDKQVLVASGQRTQEVTCLVGEDLAGDGFAHSLEINQT